MLTPTLPPQRLIIMANKNFYLFSIHNKDFLQDTLGTYITPIQRLNCSYFLIW